MFDVELPDLSPEQGDRIVARIAEAGGWPAHYVPRREERRWFGVIKAYPHVLELATEDDRGHVLIAPDVWDEERWRLRPDAHERLATTLAILAEEHPAPFTFRATWSGSPIERDEELTASELATLIRADQLNDHTRYRVWSPATKPPASALIARRPTF